MLGAIAPGDSVVTWSTQGRLLNRQTTWLWQLQRAEQFILSFEQVQRERARLASILWPISAVYLAGGLLLLCLRRPA